MNAWALYVSYILKQCDDIDVLRIPFLIKQKGKCGILPICLWCI